MTDWGYPVVVVVVAVILVVWFWISIFASGIKERDDNCGKNYPIDYVLNTNLFCEITDE